MEKSRTFPYSVQKLSPRIIKTADISLKLKRVPVSKWGCTPVESGYKKQYKLGQGSFGLG